MILLVSYKVILDKNNTEYEIHHYAHEECKSAVAASTGTKFDFNGEQILNENTAFLVFPAGNKSVAVDVRITEGRLLISVPDSEDNKDEIEDH